MNVGVILQGAATGVQDPEDPGHLPADAGSAGRLSATSGFNRPGDVVDRAMGFAVGVLVLSLAACETERSIGPPKVTATFGVGA